WTRLMRGSLTPTGTFTFSLSRPNSSSKRRGGTVQPPSADSTKIVPGGGGGSGASPLGGLWYPRGETAHPGGQDPRVEHFGRHDRPTSCAVAVKPTSILRERTREGS